MITSASCFAQVLSQCSALAATKGRKFRFKNPLRSLDATVIDLCMKVFDWARFRRTKGAIKLHLQLDHRGCLPCWALVTDGKTHEAKAAQGLSFAPGTIVAMDRGYNDYRLFAAWTEAGVFFVTRAKDNMVYEVVEDHEVPLRGNALGEAAPSHQVLKGRNRLRGTSALRTAMTPFQGSLLLAGPLLGGP